MFVLVWLTFILFDLFTSSNDQTVTISWWKTEFDDLHRRLLDASSGQAYSVLVETIDSQMLAVM